MTTMPPLETTRLLIRPFIMEDLQDVHQLLDIDLGEAKLGTDKYETLSERAEWLQWAALNHTQLAKLYQPPYGDRAVVLKSTGQLIGACGYVPCLMPFKQLPGFSGHLETQTDGLYSTEFGLFYAISPAHQQKGYATEAAQALIDYAFKELKLRRVIATTTYDNPGSQGVMRKLDMRIERNPLPEPPWLQVVGVAENQSAETSSA
jgi:[ribosomal protein S5]-alanine N-acetyltransferase